VTTLENRANSGIANLTEATDVIAHTRCLMTTSSETRGNWESFDMLVCDLDKVDCHFHYQSCHYNCNGRRISCENREAKNRKIVPNNSGPHCNYFYYQLCIGALIINNTGHLFIINTRTMVHVVLTRHH